MQVAIIQYKAGNTQSVIYALNRLGINPLLTDNPEEILKADKVILPGVGHAAPAMQHLRAKGLDKVIPQIKQNFLGVCLGMQLLCNDSEEGETPCLGIFDITVKKFLENHTEGFKVPHMGWNQIKTSSNTLFKGLQNDSFVYFVHSYYVPQNAFSIADSHYIHPFSAAIAKDNFYATQFHPEKSSLVGAKILENFISL